MDLLRAHAAEYVSHMRPLTPMDRFRAWLVTGPLARGAAFVIDLAVLAVRSLRRKPPEAGGR
jgi:hypothetical protein